MNKVFLNVNFLVDGILRLLPTVMFYEQSDDEEIQDIYFELNTGEYFIKSKVCADFEYAIKYLQKSLPSNIDLACCQSCRHGNFCPYGDNDNEIFCFKDIEIKNIHEVCLYFSDNSTIIIERKRNLLDFCTDYKPISHNNFYTYNDWKLEL